MIKIRPIFCPSGVALAMLSCTMLTIGIAGCGGGDADSETADSGTSSDAAGATTQSTPSGGPGGPPAENFAGSGGPGGPPAENFAGSGGPGGPPAENFSGSGGPPGMSSSMMMSMGGDSEEDQYNEEFGGADMDMEMDMGMSGGMSGGGNAAGRSGRPPRPDTFDQWTPTNFREAVEDGDSRVLEAIADRGVVAAGNTRYAEMLEELLGMSASLGTAAAGNAGGFGMGGMQEYGMEEEFGEDAMGMQRSSGQIDPRMMQGSSPNGAEGANNLNDVRARMGYGPNMGSGAQQDSRGSMNRGSADPNAQQQQGSQPDSRSGDPRASGAGGRGPGPQSSIDHRSTHPSQSAAGAVALLDGSEVLALDSLTVMLGEASLGWQGGKTLGIPNEAAAQAGGGQPGGGQPGRGPGGVGGPGAGASAPGAAPGGKSSGMGVPGGGAPGGGPPGMSAGMPSVMDPSAMLPGMGTGAMNMGSGGMGMGMGMGSGGAANNNFGGFAPVGTLDRREFVGTIVQALFDNGTDRAWGTINKLTNGEIDTGLESDEITGLIVDSLVARTDERSREFLADLVRQNSGNGAVARSLAGYGAGMIDRFMGVDQVLANAGQAQQSQQGFGGGFGSSGFGGGENFGEEEYPDGAEAGFNQAMMRGPGGRGGPAGMAPGMAAPGAEGAGMGRGFGGFGNQPGGNPGAGNQPGGISLGVIDVTSKSVSDAAFPEVAAYLLGAELTQSVASQLDSAADAASALDMFGLAATLPNPDTRRAAMAFLRRNEKTSMGGLVSSGVFQSVVRDPGVLVMLKTLAPPKKTGSAARQNANGAGDMAADNTETAVRQVADRVRDQLRLASMQGGLTALPPGFPIKLHRNAEVDVAYETSWPRAVEDTAGEGLAVAPTKLYYARSVIMPQNVRDMQSVVSHYERSTRGRKHEYVSEKILRFDTQVTLPNGSKRSIDVYIAEAQAAGGGNFGGGFGGGEQFGGEFGNQGGQGLASAYTMELFIVEIDDPEATPSEVATTASTEALTN